MVPYRGLVATSILVAGCDGPSASRFLAYTRDGDTYAVEPRAIPALEDPWRMDGALGRVRYGGRLSGDVSHPDYTGGSPVAVRYEVHDDVAVPLDQDGLLLFSFYGHLGDVCAALEARGADVAPLFPLPMAWNPAASVLLEFSPADNAAYVIGTHVFVLLPDGDDRDVPVLANAGVVAHETGHALLHLLTRGEPTAAPLVVETGTVPAMWQAALHEAFADVTATLLLDDPDFLGPSIAQPARDVSGGATLTDELLPENVVTDPLFAIYDPYPLGTVFASTVWDVRLATDDADATFDWVLAATAAWSPGTEEELDGAHWIDALARTADAAQHTAFCAAVGLRLGADWRPASCP